MAKITLEEMAETALARGADQIQLVEEFPHRCGLDMPLNPHIKGDKEMLTVAELSVEDSGYGPMLWAIALEYLKEARARQAS